jgi:leader peptidase (prepilin peptidase)/N-methyltransferase
MQLDHVMLFLVGCVIGSFLNVCIHRLPRGESIVFPASRCPHCQRRLRFWENVPLVSFVVLAGRCSGCGARISWRYPLVEALAGVSVAGLFHVYGYTWDWARFCVLCLLLIPIIFIDLDHRLILNKITYPGIGLGLVLSLIAAPDHFWRPVLGLIAGGGFLYGVGMLGQGVFKQESMGGGDVKLGAMAGTFMDATGILAALFLAFVFAGVVSIIGMASGRLGRRSTIPFGPFIAAAVATFILFGDELGLLYRKAMNF